MEVGVHSNQRSGIDHGVDAVGWKQGGVVDGSLVGQQDG